MKKKETETYLRAKAALIRRRARDSRRIKARSTISKSKKDKETEEQRVIRENRERLQKQKQEFTKAWDEAKPSINTKRLIDRFKEQSKEYCNPMLNYTMQMLGIISAVGYANDELAKGLESDTAISEAEISAYANRMLRLKMILLIGNSMEVDEAILDRIIGIQVAKDFGVVNGPAPINAPPINRKRPQIEKPKSNPSVLLKKRSKAKPRS